MSRNRFLPILLAVALVAQLVIVGWGHSHAHVVDGSDSNLGVAGHRHHHHAAVGHYHVHFHDSHEHPSLPDRPTDKEDCSVCRHLAVAAILTLDLEAMAVGNAAEPVQDRESFLASTIAIGLRRPRSPPELS